MVATDSQPANTMVTVTAEIHPVDVVPAIWKAFGNANKAVTSAANAK